MADLKRNGPRVCVNFLTETEISDNPNCLSIFFSIEKYNRRVIGREHSSGRSCGRTKHHCLNYLVILKVIFPVYSDRKLRFISCVFQVESIF